MQQRIKSSLSSIAKFLFSAGIIYWLVNTGKLDFASLSQLFQPQIILVCVILACTNYILCNERWKLLLQSQDILLTRFEIWRLTLIGVFFNFVVPGGVGGDVIKGFYIAQANPEKRLISVLTVAMDRLIGLYTMIFMAVFVMIVDWAQVEIHSQLRYIFYFLLLLLAAFSVLWMIIFSNRISNHPFIENLLSKLPKGHHFVRLLKSFSAYATRKDLFFKSIGVSFLAQICSISLMAYVGNELGFIEISIKTYFFVVPIGLMVTAVPISPAGVGVGQAAFYFLFNLVTGRNTLVGPSIVTAFQIIQFGLGLWGAWYYITMKKSSMAPVKTPA